MYRKNGVTYMTKLPKKVKDKAKDKEKRDIRKKRVKDFFLKPFSVFFSVIKKIVAFFNGILTIIGTIMGNIVAGFFKSTDTVRFFKTVFLWSGIIIAYKACVYFLPFFAKEYIFFLIPVIVIFNRIFYK